MSTVLDEQTQLEEQILELQEKLAAIRRRGLGEPVKDYTFETADRGPVTLSQLFGDRTELITIHNMGVSCSYCTLWADGFNGVLPHLESRAAFAVISPDSPSVQREAAASRGWKFRMASCEKNSFALDLGFLRETEGYWPGVSAFTKKEDGSILRTGKSTFGPGDDFCAVWHLFDLLPGGIAGWEPKRSYPAKH